MDKQTIFTEVKMALIELVEKQADGDLVREMLAFAAERIMEAEIEGRTGAAKGARNIRHSVRQHSTIAKMNMPVVGTQQGQAVGHWGFQAGQSGGNATGKDSCRHSLSSFVIADRYLMSMP